MLSPQPERFELVLGCRFSKRPNTWGGVIDQAHTARSEQYVSGVVYADDDTLQQRDEIMRRYAARQQERKLLQGGAGEGGSRAVGAVTARRASQSRHSVSPSRSVHPGYLTTEAPLMPPTLFAMHLTDSSADAQSPFHSDEHEDAEFAAGSGYGSRNQGDVHSYGNSYSMSTPVQQQQQHQRDADMSSINVSTPPALPPAFQSNNVPQNASHDPHASSGYSARKLRPPPTWIASDGFFQPREVPPSFSKPL